MVVVKFISSIRTWAYETFGTEKAIFFVAMAIQEDMRINAEHIRIVDQFVQVPSGRNNNNYSNVQLIVEVHNHNDEKVKALFKVKSFIEEGPITVAPLETEKKKLEQAARRLAKSVNYVATVATVEYLYSMGNWIFIPTTLILVAAIIYVAKISVTRAALGGADRGSPYATSDLGLITYSAR
ncbi:hypothetical protein M9H77_03645 [Catharanthus roseus]|uniref:Uncharacterized protein n=1 Tax=Catharanthus roseus TaxID=4058 RepID=A0ACC0CBT2_CATRO|nr:hypothetical protein M9H77_03645 [Catharanthus roseus]